MSGKTIESTNKESSSGLCCQSIKSQYEVIGIELLKYEKSCVDWRLTNEAAALGCFRVGVSFLSVEVLETFLDDLLDINVSDKRLFIEKQSRLAGFMFLAALLAALGVGVHAFVLGVPYIHCLALSLSLCLIALLIWHRSYDKASRRLRFVHVLKSEISRRRGGADDGSVMSLSEVPL